MANAKKCDICGNYYDVPEISTDMMFDEIRNTSMVRVLRRSPHKQTYHDTMQFDSCENCLQDVLDYILTKRAESEKGETK